MPTSGDIINALRRELDTYRFFALLHGVKSEEEAKRKVDEALEKYSAEHEDE